MIADALRNFVPMPGTPEAAKSQLGQSGAAQRVNSATREQYLAYVEGEIAEGREPLRYDQWVARREPLTPQVGG